MKIFILLLFAFSLWGTATQDIHFDECQISLSSDIHTEHDNAQEEDKSCHDCCFSCHSTHQPRLVYNNHINLNIDYNKSNQVFIYMTSYEYLYSYEINRPPIS